MTSQMSEEITFGPFTLLANARLLLRQGVLVELGARAFDLLAILAACPNEVVSKADLLGRCWPDVTVEERTSRSHIANRRTPLGDGKNGWRYIATLTGGSYCFVAPVSRSGSRYDVQSEMAT